jgi:hypothetical protein
VLLFVAVVAGQAIVTAAIALAFWAILADDRRQATKQAGRARSSSPPPAGPDCGEPTK